MPDNATCGSFFAMLECELLDAKCLLMSLDSTGVCLHPLVSAPVLTTLELPPANAEREYGKPWIDFLDGLVTDHVA